MYYDIVWTINRFNSDNTYCNNCPSLWSLYLLHSNALISSLVHTVNLFKHYNIRINTSIIPLMTHFIRDSSPEQSMLCSAMSRSVGVSRHDDEDCSKEISLVG